MPIRVAVVPHTHWDREWHTPFAVLRVRLVTLMDGLLDLLERDPGFTHFLLDGQTTLVGDYLVARPAAAARLRELVHAGRLEIGPWTVLMDEFLVSGETLVRNLQHGIARAGALGAVMPVGYLPDMFGHVAQMPQLLALAGIEHAAVWRGVPAAIERTAFWWIAPDGSRVRAEYLFGSYANGRRLPGDAAGLVDRARAYEAELGTFATPGDPVLLLNGSDHLAPQPELPAAVDAANAAQDEYRFEISSLAHYLRTASAVDLPSWHGELRSGARANVLMGVASNRVDVRQAAARAERAVEQVAEPLCALVLAPSEYPAELLDYAWQHLVVNSAHDSVGACSIDEVVDAVKVRYAEARHTAVALAQQAIDTLAAQVSGPRDRLVVVNPTQGDRSGVVEATVAGDAAIHVVDDDGRAVPTQLLGADTPTVLDTRVVGTKLHWVIERMADGTWDGQPIARAELMRSSDPTVDTDLTIALAIAEPVGVDAVRAELLGLAQAGETVRVRVIGPARQPVAFAADSVPGFGWRTFRTVPAPAMPTAFPGAVTVSAASLDNGLVRLTVHPLDGTLTIEADGVTIIGANRYVESGDGGDTYNYSPPTHDVVVDTPVRVEIGIGEQGPVRGSLTVDATYRWPAAAIGDAQRCTGRRADTVETTVRTRVELRTGERFVRVHVALDHHVRDHRLRVHFPLPAVVDGSDAESAFAVVRRGLVAEGGPLEAGLPTFVSRRFVDCSGVDEHGAVVGLTVLHDGLLEYEVVDDGSQLALTLLRATGYLSRGEPQLRPNPAGPLLPLDGAQVQGRLQFDYALLPHRGTWINAELYDTATRFLVPLEVSAAAPAGTASRPTEGRLLTVEGAEVSAVYREHANGRLLVRAFNPMPDPASLRVMLGSSPTRGSVIDLLGNVIDSFDGAATIAPFAIMTLRLA